MIDSIRMGPHSERLIGGNGAKYPYGAPLVVHDGRERVQLDSALGVGAVGADLLLLSHFHEDHVAHAGQAPEVAIHLRDLQAVQSWSGYMDNVGIGPGAWEDEMKAEFGWTGLPNAESFGDDGAFEVGASTRIRVVPLPGHTPGHCGFFIEPDGVFYLADVDLSSFGPFYGDSSSSLRDTRTSLDICESIDASAYVTYHHKGPYFDRAQFLVAIAEHRKVLHRRESRIVELLGSGPKNAQDLVGSGVVYRPGIRPYYADDVERRMIRLHLNELIDRGSATEDESGSVQLT